MQIPAAEVRFFQRISWQGWELGDQGVSPDWATSFVHWEATALINAHEIPQEKLQGFFELSHTGDDPETEKEQDHWKISIS